MHRCATLMLSVAFCLFLVNINGQNRTKIDSFHNLLTLSSTDSDRVHLFNELAYEYINIEQESARLYAQKAYDLAKSINLLSGESSALMRFGSIDMFEGNYEKADSFFRLALDIRLRLGNKIDIANTYNNIGLIYFYQDDDPEAIVFYKKGLLTLADEKVSGIEAMLCYNIGESYMFLGKDKEAIKYINRGLTISDELGDVLGKANSLLNMGNWYDKMENYVKAKESFNESLKFYQQEQDQTGQAKCYINLGDTEYKLGETKIALNNFEAALRLEEYLDQSDIATLYRVRGNIFSQMNKKKEALEAYKKSLAISTELEEVADIASVRYNIGLLYKDLLDYKTALNYFENSQTIVDTIDDPTLNMVLARELSETYAELNQTDLAFQYSLKHNSLQDSLNDNYKMAMNYKFNYEEEQKKNELLEKEFELKIAESNQKSFKINAFIVGGILWFALCIVSIIAYFNQRKKLAVEQKYVEIDSRLKEQQLKTTYAKLEGQDEERTRIAQDLHDRVGSILSTVMLYFKGYDSKLDVITENQTQLLKANELLDKAVVEVRRISQNIHSGTLTKFGLKAELNALADILRDSDQIKVKVVTHGLEERLPAAMEIKVYRIIQELISNVLKHANASQITIQVNQFKDVLNVLVEDNGKGFDIEEAEKKNSMGLKNVKSRVYDLHGSIILDSNKGRGTTVSIDIPLEK